MAAPATWVVSVFVVFGAFTLSVASSVRVDQNNGFTIQETNKELSSSQFMIAHCPSYVTFLPNAGAIPADEISSVLALALGFSSFKELNWSGLLSGDIFRRPKANVLITVDGITHDDKFDVPQKSASFPVTDVDGSPTLSDIMIISNMDQLNLPSRISGMFSDKSLTVSLSGEAALAAAGYSNVANSHTLYWTQEENKFTDADADVLSGSLVDMSLTRDQLLKRFEESNFGKSVKYSASGKVFTVSIPEKGNAIFDMERTEDFLLFAEVGAMFQLLNKLSTDRSFVNDGAPDVFTLSVSALKGLRRRYGDKSPQVQGAVRFLQEVIPQIVAKFVELYSGNVLVEVLTLEWHGDLQERYPHEVRVVYEASQPHLLDQSEHVFHSQLPSVTLRDNLEEAVKSSLCQSLHNRLLSMQSNLQVNCLGESRARERRAVDALASPSPKPKNHSYNVAPKTSDDYPAIFNIWLWLLVILVLSLYVISLVLWYMDPGRDSIIYRMTSQRIKID